MKNSAFLILLLGLTIVGILGSAVLGFTIWNAETQTDQLGRMYHTWVVVAECWVGLGSVGLMLFFLWEGRHFVKTLASANYSHIYNRLDQINLLLVQHVDNGKLDLSEEVDDHYDFPFSDARTHLCDLIFTLYEEIFYQWLKFETLDQEDWARWRHSIRRNFQLQYVRKYWDDIQGKIYPVKFQMMVREIRGLNAATPGKWRSKDDEWVARELQRVS